MMPGRISSDESTWALNILKPFLEVFAGKGNVTEYLVRKLAHFSEYALLGGELSFLGFGLAVKDDLSSGRLFLSFAAVQVCVLVIAFLDETIQIFSGRGPMITDVWIDLAGAALGNIIILIIRTVRATQKNGHKA